MFASCSASVHYGITRKGWRPTCLHAAVLQFTTASRERVGDIHACKLQCFSSLRHHAKGLATYMFARCSASVHYGITRKGWRPTCLHAAVLPVHYGITRKGWRPTCLHAAVLQFTTASRERVGDLHVCKLQCFSSLRHHAKGLATYMFARCSPSVHYGITRKGWRPTCLHAAVLQFTTASCERAENVGDLHVCKRECFSSLPHHVNGLATYMFASCRASLHESINRWWLPCLLEVFCPHYSRGMADYLFAMATAVGFNVLWKPEPQ